MTDKTSVPKWITIYLWLTVLLTIGACAAGYFSPGALFSTWEAIGADGALSLAGPVGLFLSRNVATAILGLFSLTKGGVGMIKGYLVLRAASDGMDFIHNIIADNMPVAIMGLVMCAIEIFALVKLSKS